MKDRAYRKNVLGFGIGQIGSGTSFAFISMYMLFFYTNVMEIPVAIAGTIFMAARIIDAVTDPLFGMLVDKTNSRIGKFRPYLRFGAPVLGASLILMFLAPDLPLDMKILFAYTTYIIGSLARTVVDVPYHSIAVILSPDPDKRSLAISMKNLIGTFASLLVFPVMNFVKLLGGGVFAWRVIAVIIAFFVTISYWLCSFMIRDIDVKKAVVETNGKKISLKDRFQTIIKNKAILTLVVGFSTDALSGQILMGVNVYFFLYNMSGKTDLIVLTQMPRVLGIFIVAAVIGQIVKKTGKRMLFLISEAVLIIPCVVLLFLPPTAVIPIVIVFIFISFIQIFSMVASWGMLADSADYAELKFGIKSAATITSTFTFCNKAAQAIGIFITGLILSSLGFVEGAETQTQRVMDGILYLISFGSIAAFVVSIIAMIFYPIKKNDEIRLAEEIKSIREKEGT